MRLFILSTFAALFLSATSADKLNACDASNGACSDGDPSTLYPDNRRDGDMLSIQEARLRAAQSERALALGDAGTSLALAIEAFETQPDSVEAERALHFALSALRERTVLDGHTYRVSAAHFSADGEKIVTGDHDGVVRVWDAETGERLNRIETETSQMADMALSPDAERVATAPGYTDVPRLVDLTSGDVIAELAIQAGSFRHIAFNQDGTRLLAAGYGRPIAVWDGETGEFLHAFERHNEAGNVHIGAMAQDTNGARIATGDSRGLIWIWDIENPEAALLLEGDPRGIRGLEFSPDGTMLLSISWSGSVRLWNTNTGEELRQWQGDFTSVSFSPDGESILLGGAADGVLAAASLFDVGTGDLLRLLHGTDDRFYDAQLSADGQHVLARTQKNVFVWDAATGRQVAQLVGHEAAKNERIESLSFSPDGTRVLTAGGYGNERVSPDAATARIWDIRDNKPETISLSFRLPQDGPDQRPRSVSGYGLSADGAFATFWSQSENVIWLWDLQSGSSRVLDAHEGRIRSLAFNEAGSQFLTSDDFGDLILWDVATGNVAQSWRNEQQRRGSALFAPDGTPLNVSISEGELTLLDLNTGHVWLQVLNEVFYDYEFSHFAFSADGRWFLGSGEEGPYSFVLDVSTKEFSATEVSGAVDTRGGRAVSADGSLLLTAEDGVVTITEIESGSERFSTGWFSPFSFFSSTSFDPTGNLIATAGPDEAVWIRDGRDASLVQLIRTFGGVNSAYFSPDGGLLVLTPRDGPVRILASNPFDDRKWREIAAIETSLAWLSRRAVFTPDGTGILVWSRGGAELFPVPERGSTILDTARNSAPRCLSVDERERYFLDPVPPRWCITGAGLEGEARVQNWQPVSPYRTLEWRQWLLSQNLPRDPTEF